MCILGKAGREQTVMSVPWPVVYHDDPNLNPNSNVGAQRREVDDLEQNKLRDDLTELNTTFAA